MSGRPVLPFQRGPQSQSLLAALLCALATLTPGCGGGSFPLLAPPAAPAGNGVGISGTWLFQLSYDQAAAVGANVPAGNVTRIRVPLTQDVAGSISTLSSSAAILGADVGCKVPTASWIATGSFGIKANFTLTSGTVQSSTINLSLNEFPDFFLPPTAPNATGQMTFTGTLNADGTMSGTMSDTCVLDAGGQPKQGTWIATKS